MTAAEALAAAREAGLRTAADGDDLLLEADTEPPAMVLAALKHHKAEILALVRSEAGTWSREDWRAFFDERAAIAEFVGGLSQPDAEVQALEWCIVEWMNRNPESSDTGQCAWCGLDTAGPAILPFGRNATGHAWLHDRCWEGWYRVKRKRVVRALASLGIPAPGSVHESGSAQPCLVDLPKDFGKSGGD